MIIIKKLLCIDYADAEVFYYKLSMGLCLTMVIFILLLIVALLMIKQIHKRFSKSLIV